MESNKNIFCASNPARLLDALWSVIGDDIGVLHELIIFLPSRRAVRSVEKMLVDKIGNAVLLPQLVPLGEGADENPDEIDDDAPDVISNTERILITAKLLTADANIRTISNALPIARDLVRMQDYLENEGNDSSQINWMELVDEKYAAHFERKAQFLNTVTGILPTCMGGRITQSKKRNDDIRAWMGQLSNARKVIVCGSTASVPATADLMIRIANMPNGYIILPGKIRGCIDDFELNSNPYNSEYKLLQRIGITPDDVCVIDVGASDVDLFNAAFSNAGEHSDKSCRAQLIEAPRESVEAECVAEIAARAIGDNKSVLVITPDAAGNQRIAESFARRNLIADFSGGKPGTMTLFGRALLNLFDAWLEDKDFTFANEYEKNSHNLFETLVSITESNYELMTPQFPIDDEINGQIWDAILNVSDILLKNGIVLNASDARAIVADALSGVSVRSVMQSDAKICVLGTIESRMQTADVVILTGLNEGMFPGLGYENAWLPRNLSEEIGLPSPDRKVSLMALDFINLSCASTVYWTRSRTAGSSQTTESRFLSRVNVAQNGIVQNTEILDAVHARDNVPYAPLVHSPPTPPASRDDVYVTELELLIHNPYAFYVRHILRLRPKDDYWTEPDARDFGNLVHAVVENAAGKNAQQMVDEMDALARERLPKDNVVFHFWHKRFVEMAPEIEKMLNISADASVEIKGSVKIAGRTVRAKADRIWDGCVLDIKTGAAPSEKQLLDGNMPQLPLEAYMLQTGGFPIKSSAKSLTPALQFLQLRNKNVDMITYDGETAQKMIDASVQKVSELFGRYAKDFEPYEYYETSDKKYKAYDDLARVDD